jgi:hypothetical protein
MKAIFLGNVNILRQMLPWRILKNVLEEFMDYALDAICETCNTLNTVFIMTCIVFDVDFPALPKRLSASCWCISRL